MRPTESEPGGAHRKQAPPGPYSIEKFVVALSPLWRALDLHSGRHESLARVHSISQRQYRFLGRVLALEDVYDIADYLASLVEDGRLPADASTFVFSQDQATVLRETPRWLRNARDQLRHLGYY